VSGEGDVLIDDLRCDDWDQVRRIYQDGLDTGNASFEVEAPAWDVWDQKHHRHSRLVVRHNGGVVAWAALAPMSHRPCYAGVAEVSLYVAPAFRGQGIGKRLLEALIESSERHGIWSLYGHSFPENAGSIQLQLACGFRIVGRRERIAQRAGVWRDTVLTERRSQVVGTTEAGQPATRSGQQAPGAIECLPIPQPGESFGTNRDRDQCTRRR
jgi:phosphinothricin acetyltransferase